MKHIINVTNISKEFRDSVWNFHLPGRKVFKIEALKNVNFNVDKGEIFGLLGPNGAGKTTLLKILSTLIYPDSGSAEINGYDLKHEKEIKRYIGLVTGSERSFYWRLTGRQNLEFFASLHNVRSSVINKRIKEISDILGLNEFIDLRFDKYSSGMKQRLDIARAMINKPEILFLDEPTKSVDPVVSVHIRETLKILSKRYYYTIFLVSHQIDEIKAVCDRVAIMNKGEIKNVVSLKEQKNTINFEKSVFKETTIEEIFQKFTCVSDSRKEKFSTPETEIYQSSLRELKNQDGIEQIKHKDDDEEEKMSDYGSEIFKSVRNLIKKMRIFFLRDLFIQSSYKFDFLLQFGSIFFNVAIFYYMTRLFENIRIPGLENYGGDFFSFILTGIAFTGFLGVGLSSFSEVIRNEQVQGTLEIMLASPTSLWLILLSSSIWGFLFTGISVIIYLLFGVIIFGFNISNSNYLAAILIILLTVIIFSSIGILSASFIMVFKKGSPINFLIQSASGLLGGVLYPIEVLPWWLKLISNCLPITYSLRAIRHALLQNWSFGKLWNDIFILVCFVLIFMPLSQVIFTMSVKKAKYDGSLAKF